MGANIITLVAFAIPAAVVAAIILRTVKVGSLASKIKSRPRRAPNQIRLEIEQYCRTRLSTASESEIDFGYTSWNWLAEAVDLPSDALQIRDEIACISISSIPFAANPALDEIETRLLSLEKDCHLNDLTVLDDGTPLVTIGDYIVRTIQLRRLSKSHYSSDIV